MSFVIPTSREMRHLVDVLKEIRDVEQQRLDVERLMLRIQQHDHFAVELKFNAKVEGLPLQKGITMLQLTDVQKCDLSIQPVDARGNPAPVDGAPSWSVSDTTILSITPSTDGLSATIFAVGPLGSSQVNVSADADLGSGVTTIAGVLDVTVVAGQATTVNIATGTPTAQ